MTYTYDLTVIPGFIDTIKVPENKEPYFSVFEYFTKANEKYQIIRYNKDIFVDASDNSIFSTYGLLRSVILSSFRVVSFAPPKSVNANQFTFRYRNKTSNIVAEEFVEGTMVNAFFDPTYGATGCWQIATRNTVGAEVKFYKDSNKNFNTMFMEACIENNFNLQTLNPRFCYSFVLQHPENRIVVPFKKPQLYLVEVYEIINKYEDVKVIQQDIIEVKKGGLWHLTGVKFPERYEFTDYLELIEKYASPNTPYNIMGVIFKNLDTGERIKYRNPIYEEVRHLRGNQAKLQYQYLYLRKNGKMPEFLKYYPEMKYNLNKYRDQLHMFTRTLYSNYINCYIKKAKPLIEYSVQYRTHMFKLHEKYLLELKPSNLFVNFQFVINYVNNLEPSLLMFSLNYNMRQRMNDMLLSK